MEDTKPLYKIRDAKVSDQAFIFSSFLKGLYYGNDFYRQIDKEAFMSNYKKVLTQLLIKSQCKVAVQNDDDDSLIGYSIYEPGILHYLFVKPTFRRFGVAKSLVPVGINTTTHITKIGTAIKPKEWIFNPFKI